MDKQARSKKTTPERRKELYDLHLRRHDRINNWDLVHKATGWMRRFAGDKDPPRLLKFLDQHAATCHALPCATSPKAAQKINPYVNQDVFKRG